MMHTAIIYFLLDKSISLFFEGIQASVTPNPIASIDTDNIEADIDHIMDFISDYACRCDIPLYLRNYLNEGLNMCRRWLNTSDNTSAVSFKLNMMINAVETWEAIVGDE